MKILVADDHPLIREALKHVLHQLDEDMNVVEAKDSEGVLNQVGLSPDLDLVVLDLGLPGVSGFAVLDQLRKQYPAVPVVILSAHDQHENVTKALDRGAAGFIPKNSSNEVMLSAIRLVLSGGVYLPPEILEHGSADQWASVSPDAAPLSAERVQAVLEDLGLTRRQRDVLALMLEGKSNKLICRELDLAEGTVKIHVSAILRALKVNTRAEAIVALNRLGLSSTDHISDHKSS